MFVIGSQVLTGLQDRETLETVIEELGTAVEESDDQSFPRRLADALPDRSFTFGERDTILLNCGEVMVVQGRNHVEFYWSVPQVLQDAVRAPADPQPDPHVDGELRHRQGVAGVPVQ